MPETGRKFSARKEKPQFGCLTRLVFYLVLGSIAVILITAVFAPWGFYLGGKFRPIPYWQGWGKLHSTISGEYVVFVRFWPSTQGRLNSFVTGVGYVCTPRGERIRLNLAGTMRRHLNLSTDGEEMYIKIYKWQWVNVNAQRHPRIELRGRWRNPNLVMNDDGSISREFQRDGSVYLGSDTNHPYKLEVLPITLTEGSYSEFESACTAMRR